MTSLSLLAGKTVATLQFCTLSRLSIDWQSDKDDLDSLDQFKLDYSSNKITQTFVVHLQCLSVYTVPNLFWDVQSKSATVFFCTNNESIYKQKRHTWCFALEADLGLGLIVVSCGMMLH